MKTKRKRHQYDALIVIALWASAVVLSAWLCLNSMYYQFDGVAPCTPESSVCLEVAK